MNRRFFALRTATPDSDLMPSRRLEDRREGTHASVLGRLIAALVMGIVLVMLSAVLHTAAAAAVAGGWSYLWASSSVAIMGALFIALGSPTGRIAWGRLCALSGLVSGGLVVASTVVALRGADTVFGDLAGQAASQGLARPIGGALGGALLSGALGIVAFVIAVVFLVASYVLLHASASSNRPAH